MNESSAAFKLETVNKLLQQFFQDKQKTKLSGDALKLMAEFLQIFIAGTYGPIPAVTNFSCDRSLLFYLEAAARAGKQAKAESSSTVQIENLEKILPQLLLDF